MLLFVPIGVGIVVGLIIIVLTIILKKKRPSWVKIPTYLSLLAAIGLFIVSFLVRGFEGAAYGITSIVIFIFSILTFFTSKSNIKTKTND